MRGRFAPYTRSAVEMAGDPVEYVVVHELEIAGVRLDEGPDEGADGDDRPPFDLTSSNAPLTSARPTPMPAYSSKTSVWTKKWRLATLR